MIPTQIVEYYTPEILLLISVKNDGLLPDNNLLQKSMHICAVEEWRHGHNQYMDKFCHCNDCATLNTLNHDQYFHLIWFNGFAKDYWEACKSWYAMNCKFAMHKSCKGQDYIALGFKK